MPWSSLALPQLQAPLNPRGRHCHCWPLTAHAARPPRRRRYRKPRSSYKFLRPELQQRGAAFKKGSAYLERYTLLIAFTFFLEHVGAESSEWGVRMVEGLRRVRVAAAGVGALRAVTVCHCWGRGMPGVMRVMRVGAIGVAPVRAVCMHHYWEKDERVLSAFRPRDANGGHAGGERGARSSRLGQGGTEAQPLGAAARVRARS